jgi:hypothetical protein
MEEEQIITEEELKLLFPNKIQRDIFIKMMNKLVVFVKANATVMVTSLRNFEC